MNKQFLILIFLLAFFIGSQAGADTYSYSVDRFEISGNLPGYTLDDFNDGVLSPWVIWEDTVTEAGGVVTLSNPGEMLTPFLFNGLIIQAERSCLANEPAGSGPFYVEGGKGNFSATTRWIQFIPGQNHFFGMQLGYDWFDAGDQDEDINLNIYNFDATLANALGVSPGLNIWLLKDTSSTPPLSNVQTYSINPADITGDIFLQINFDDTTDLISVAFSLDGGSTYQTPFTPVTSNLDNASSMHWLLETESMLYSIESVPTVSEWGMIIFFILLLGSALWVIRLRTRRKLM